MRARKVLIISGFLMTWTFVTYFFLLRDNAKFPLSPRSRVAQKLTHLHNSAIGEYHKSKVFMETIVDLLRIKYLTESQEQTESLKELSTAGAAAAPPPPALNPPRNEKNKSGIGIVPLSPEHPLSIPKPDSVENVITANDNDRVAQAAKPVKATVTHMPNGQPIIPVVVFACNRVSIKKCLDNLVQYRPSMEQFPIIVSQDCGDQATKNMIQSFKEKVQLIEQPDLTDIQVPPKEKKFKGYYKIARHYGWALNEVFGRGYEFVIIVEDDLNVAPDFYEYFLGTYKLLQQDSSLWCVSAWNDNGKANFVDPSHPELLYRTDFFPGLGWMLSNNLWQELSVKWPKSFWDDWIRHPEQRKNRVCIRPEISRTRTFGKIGVSNGLFFDKYLRYIKLSEDYVEFTNMNLTYLLRENYDRTFLKRVYAYPIVTYDELRRNLITTDEPVRIQYNTKDQYKRITKLLGLMDDFKSGVPRTAYHGIVSFYYNKRRVHLAPNINWKGYDLSWS